MINWKLRRVQKELYRLAKQRETGREGCPIGESDQRREWGNTVERRCEAKVKELL